VAPGATPPATLAAAERGRRLFVAKGCVTCHVHAEASGGASLAVGPELTGKRFAAEYLARFLANPAIKTDRMPDLGLKPAEIAALSAFINADRSGKVD
jgi:mono/diheme cytochrome c family protein